MLFEENQVGSFFVDFCFASIWFANSWMEIVAKGLPFKISFVISDFKLSEINCWTSSFKIQNSKEIIGF